MFRLLNTAIFMLAFAVISFGFTNESHAQKSSVDYACGTRLPIGAFYSESGRVKCEDEVGGANKEIAANSKTEIFCFYQAVCTPITPAVRKSLMETAKASTPQLNDWADLDDDVLNQAVIKHIETSHKTALAKGEAPPALDLTEMSVQCLGSKTQNGNPDCPRVNACVNSRKNASLYWKVKPLNPSMNPQMTDSKGFRVRQSGPAAPSGVAQ